MIREPSPRSIVRLLAALLSAALLAALLLSVATAQDATEEPEPTPTPEGVPPPDAVVRVEVDPLIQPINDGVQFEAVVSVEADNLAAFDFALSYDTDRLEPVEQDLDEPPADLGETAREIPIVVTDMGLFLEESDRGPTMQCRTPAGRPDTGEIIVSCNTVGPPVCVDGEVGASGSGILGRVQFTSLGGGETPIEITDSNLILDDVEPCDPEVFTVRRIPHRQESTSVTLTGGGGGSGLLIGIVIGVVVVAVVGAGGALVWYRQRSRQRPATPL